ncbi:outer membrane protein [Methylopila turkensis]|uniref:Outer membrane protein n=1 Tax=Methylopila turkensis TaxID=1437816 RepID=A0A9W6N5X2_9HYPH|nr:outer membrane protein [Methylopila turkensis]GLK78716.1 outer membrane protein [Methylopila turkensis]
MKRATLFGGAAALALWGGAAFAADIPAYEAAPAVAAPVPSFTWSGPYLGLQAGYGWFDADNRVNGFKPDSSPDGFTVGAYAGYNHQLENSPLVLGVEADINYTDGDARRGTRGFTGASDTRIGNDVGFTGAVRARVGYAFDRFLVYGAGGLAFADHEVKARATAPGGASGSDDTVAVGWTIGGGVEAALSDNVTARVEYRYSDFGTDSFSVAGSRVKSDLTENRVMLGVGYKFSSGW